MAERIKPWTGFARDAIGGVLEDSPFSAVVPVDEVSFAVVALYLGLEMLTQLDGDRRPADALFARVRTLASLFAGLGGSVDRAYRRGRANGPRHGPEAEVKPAPMSVDDGCRPPAVAVARRASPTGRTRWSWRGKQVALRLVLLSGAYLVWGALALILYHDHWRLVGERHLDQRPRHPDHPARLPPSTNRTRGRCRSFSSGLPVRSSSPPPAWFGGWSADRQRVGVTGMIVAGLAGVVAVLGHAHDRHVHPPGGRPPGRPGPPHRPGAQGGPPPPGAPPGWYGDPAGTTSWRYWNGRAWTDDFAPMVRE